MVGEQQMEMEMEEPLQFVLVSLQDLASAACQTAHHSTRCEIWRILMPIEWPEEVPLDTLPTNTINPCVKCTQGKFGWW